jgi:magnesium transporter
MDILSREVISVQVDAPQDDVARLFTRYDLPLMPVLNHDGRLVGVITIDDVIDVIEEEATTDFYRLGGLSAQEGLGTPFDRALRLRLPWLLLGLTAACVAAWVISLFQDILLKYVLLAAFMHPIAASSAWAGQQTLTVLLGGLATGDLDLRRTWRVVARQIGLGLLNGLATGALLAFIALLWERNVLLSLILLVAQIVSLSAASAVGASLPLMLRRFGADPALASSVLVVAVSDLIGLTVFLGLAALLATHLL